MLKRKLLSIATLILLVSIPVFSFSIKERHRGISYLPNQYISPHQDVIILTLDRKSTIKKLQKPDKRNGVSEPFILGNSEQKISKQGVSSYIELNNHSFEGKSKYRVMEMAAVNGDIQLLNEILPLIKDVDTPLNPKYSTMLMAAAKNQQVEFIEQLLQYGADINYTTDYGYNALVAAVKSRDIETIRFLLENGAEVQKFQGISVMAYAVATGDMNVIALIKSFGASYSDTSDISPMVITVMKQNSELFNEILNADINLNQPDMMTGRTPLLAAVSVEDRSMVEAILDKEINIDYADVSGNTALHYVARRGGVEILELLIVSGADIDRINNITGESALIIAAKNEKCQMVDALITEGANVEQMDYLDRTAADYLADSTVCKDQLF